jgi:hypothetical protein
MESKLYNDYFAELAGCPCKYNVTECLRNKTAAEILETSKLVAYDVLTYSDKLFTMGYYTRTRFISSQIQ